MAFPSISLSHWQIEQFHQQGFLILDTFLDTAQVNCLIERIEPLFDTRFETGIYPDEWHGRPGLNQPNATRHMSGLWRCDRTVASFSLAAPIAQLNATLAGWSGGRLATDSCWLKPPNAPEVLFHRNNTYAACLNPPSLVTCWIALSDCTADTGTLEIVPGSHRWRCTDQIRFLHAPSGDYRQPVWQAATEAGIAEPEIVAVELPPGGCIVLHGDLWHGSGRNQTGDRTRRSFAVSTLPVDAHFQPAGTAPGYIFSRYQRQGSLTLDESFFPIVWRSDGYRSPLIDAYCQDALSRSR